MRKIVLALAAAGTLLAGGIAMAEPIRMAQVDVRIGEGRSDWDRGRDWDRRRGEGVGVRFRAGDDGVRVREGVRFREGARGEFRGGCKTVTIKERRGDTVVVKRIQRC